MTRIKEVDGVAVYTKVWATNNDTGTSRVSICAQNSATSSSVRSQIPETETINFPDTSQF